MTAISDKMFLYDPGIDIYTQMIDLPFPWHRFSILSAGSDIIFIGGFDGYGNEVKTVFRYDPGVDNFTDINTLLYEGNQPGLHDPCNMTMMHDGRIFVCGSGSGSNTGPSREAYIVDQEVLVSGFQEKRSPMGLDPRRLKSNVAPLPMPLKNHACTKINDGRILVAGGITADS